ncbi:SRR1-domain-containing protein [Umbelopsis sp. PMI_123]|nr:SRR1-domain-containing protein [Umbelopsis sp. PMI_123]
MEFKYQTVKTKRGKKNANRKKNFVDISEWTVQDVVQVLDRRREALLDSNFYSELLSILQDKVVSESPHDIVCYGVGSIQESKNAQYQFILALLMRDLIKLPGALYIYDPIFTELDIKVCEHYNTEIIKDNEHGRRTVEQRTLFYMPHCGKSLYSNTLEANWNAEQLPNVIVVGNRFENYTESLLDRELKRDCPYLIPAVKVVACTPFPTEFDNNQIFNDLCVQTFPKDTLANVEKSFWQKLETAKDNDSDGITDDVI